jgi:hypothetical protein
MAVRRIQAGINDYNQSDLPQIPPFFDENGEKV